MKNVKLLIDIPVSAYEMTKEVKRIIDADNEGVVADAIINGILVDVIEEVDKSYKNIEIHDRVSRKSLISKTEKLMNELEENKKYHAEMVQSYAETTKFGMDLVLDIIKDEEPIGVDRKCSTCKYHDGEFCNVPIKSGCKNYKYWSVNGLDRDSSILSQIIDRLEALEKKINTETLEPAKFDGSIFEEYRRCVDGKSDISMCNGCYYKDSEVFRCQLCKRKERKDLYSKRTEW